MNYTDCLPGTFENNVHLSDDHIHPSTLRAIRARKSNRETQPYKQNICTRFVSPNSSTCHCEIPVVRFSHSELKHANEIQQVTEGLELDELEGQFNLAHTLCKKQHVPIVYLHKPFDPVNQTSHNMQAKEMEDVLQFKEGLTEFATDVYEKIIKLQAGKTMMHFRLTNLFTHVAETLANSVVSPMSIYCVSLLVMAGADGETLQKMQQVPHIPPKIRSDAVHQSCGPIISKYFEASSDVDLNLANRLFLLSSIDIRPEYSALVAKCYKALVELAIIFP
ncbi:hypothetical protein T265_07411 [Opisthorchis viverrini]|uniref:Serpin domain-containing protein n=1 Tax=Opisthorchis viverrini TaxID=6198 RepID=A0A074ZHA1_OPIVI|nr:hypothetical protein T265_07411 [Opisthorchis viverrini]KER25077.1 hypothetical protein T265_07411 [Opisthorchis viverrini]